MQAHAYTINDGSDGDIRHGHHDHDESAACSWESDGSKHGTICHGHHRDDGSTVIKIGMVAPQRIGGQLGGWLSVPTIETVETEAGLGRWS